MASDWPLTGLAVAAALLAIAVILWLIAARRTSPEKREKRRRTLVNRVGRLTDGVVVEANATSLFYTYSVGGVGYHASQDISHLSKYLPDEASKLVGPVWLKYAPRNPANSIVVCEGWSGFRGWKEMETK
jgi:hypothetical protein